MDDGRGGVGTTSVRIDAGNNPPAPAISSPASSHRFYVGESIMLDGSATDPEDGALPATALTWEVIRHHDTHTHPFLPPTSGNGLQITAPAPEDISATTTTYLEIMLTATDSRGLSQTVSQEVRPRLVDLMFDTVPTGLRLEIAGSSIVAPTTVTSWEGWQIPVNAPDQVDSSGQGTTFVSWSDSGTRAHEVPTPQAPATYTATFTQRYARPQGATPTRLSLAPAYRECTQPNRTHGEPLAYVSCAPPLRASDHLTVGTPDANGQPASSVGLARLRVLPGDPATVEDEADVALELSMSDVRVAPTLEDYSGELAPSIQLRVTDGYNGASSTDAATDDGLVASVHGSVRGDARLLRRKHVLDQHVRGLPHTRDRGRGLTRDMGARQAGAVRRRRRRRRRHDGRQHPVRDAGPVRALTVGAQGRTVVLRARARARSRARRVWSTRLTAISTPGMKDSREIESWRTLSVCPRPPNSTS